jgi:hypothetical protein
MNLQKKHADNIEFTNKIVTEDSLKEVKTTERVINEEWKSIIISLCNPRLSFGHIDSIVPCIDEIILKQKQKKNTNAMWGTIENKHSFDIMPHLLHNIIRIAPIVSWIESNYNRNIKTKQIVTEIQTEGIKTSRTFM